MFYLCAVSVGGQGLLRRLNLTTCPPLAGSATSA